MDSPFEDRHLEHSKYLMMEIERGLVGVNYSTSENVDVGCDYGLLT